MESLSRPFQSKKLSNATTKHPYDGVFSGNRHKFTAGATAIDYREIFGNSQSPSSSIPVLDLSTLGERSPNMMLNSKPDYSNIFGSRDHDDVDCYQQLFASDKFRPPSSTTTTTTSHDSDVFSRRSSDELTQFNMSYNKVSQQNKGGLDRTKHVTQLHPTPGFSRVIDEHVSPPKMKSEKLKSSPVHVNDDSSNKNQFVSEDKNVRTFVSSPSASTINVVKHKRFESRERKTSPVSFDEELDVNSAASALKKAIEKAQESIRVAKESVGRKKKGLENFSSKNAKEGSKVRNRMDDVTVFPDFVGGEKLSVAKKVIEEMNGKILDGSNSARVTGETESKVLHSGGSFEYATSPSEAVQTEKVRTEPVEFEHEAQTMNMVVDDYEGKIEVTKTASGDLEHQSVVEEEESVERVEVEMFRESKENTENVTRLESLENEKQEEVLEQEDVENAENPESYKQIEDVFNCSGSENESEVHEEETVEMFNNVSELETKASVQTFDNGIEEINESARVYDYSFEETETTIHEACKVDINDKNVETTREVSDITETMEGSFESETDKVYESDNEDKYESKSEENDVQSELSFGTIDGVKIEDDESNKEDDIIDTLVDLGSENDLQSESSSSSTKTLEEESTTQPPQNEKPDTIEDSRMRGKEHSRTIHEETAKERENEKNRIAVNRAIREARERAFIEARERAEFERAAVEKATEEVRQRMMAEAREKVAKASAATKLSSEKTSAESKLRAERAAVERATSEARQRALEKAMSQKSVSDLNSSESALRSKMKLEKDNRIMERAARALAEKEKRDLLAQKEQAERNRLAENLDADIKKWSNGKERNLRALLSTLQYILGPESGWQAVSLAEIVTSSAVKKAYRKATLCVHPDKLQQRGATIQHKYICEKVFDLLKAAWNKFNSEEK